MVHSCDAGHQQNIPREGMGKEESGVKWGANEEGGDNPGTETSRGVAYCTAEYPTPTPFLSSLYLSAPVSPCPLLNEKCWLPAVIALLASISLYELAKTSEKYLCGGLSVISPAGGKIEHLNDDLKSIVSVHWILQSCVQNAVTKYPAKILPHEVTRLFLTISRSGRSRWKE